MTKQWKLEDAKAALSQVIREAEREPQVITRHGKRAAVLLAPEAYDRLTGQGQSTFDALRGAHDFSNFDEDELAFPRDRGSPREIDF